MSGLPGPASPFIEEILVGTRDEMVRRFGITVEEAEGRIASTFGSFDLESPDTEAFLGHEEDEHWAEWVYYGHDALWKSRASGIPPQPKPWP